MERKSNLELVRDGVEEEYKEFEAYELKRTPEQLIHEDNYRIRFYNELSEYFSSDSVEELDKRNFEALSEDLPNVLDLLYDYYLSSEYVSINNYEDVRNFIESYNDKYHKEIMEGSRTEPATMELNSEKKIRFIDSKYRQLFTIPDGSQILVHYPDDRGLKAFTCHYVDEYHFYDDRQTVFHICQFAEIMEKIGATYEPFPEKRMIWSNRDLNVEDWRNELLAEDPTLTKDQLYAKMVETNDLYFYDERRNLDQHIGGDIILIADIGRWNGRFSGYKELHSDNLQDCLQFESDCEYGEWYIDSEGELKSTQSHHDGTHYILYRAFKPETTDEEKDKLKELIYDGKATQADIDKYTDKLGFETAKIYGWEFPTEEKQRSDKKRDEVR